MLGMMNVWRWGLPAAAVALLGTSVYSTVDLARERRQAQELSATNASLRASLSQMGEQLQTVSNQLNRLTAQPPAPAPVEPVKPAPRVRTNAPKPREDPRWSKMQARLTDQQQQLNSAREELGKTREELEGKLSSSHDELSGSIARNHDELVALEKRGERNYYEFEIDKSKQFRKVGPLSVSLRKVNQKHGYYDLALMFDDRQLEKKHVNLYEPMLLSTSDRPQPIELVVNQIHDNFIKGYISEPKFRKDELALTHVSEEKPKVLQQR